jgi:hypothetical protein
MGNSYDPIETEGQIKQYRKRSEPGASAFWHFNPECSGWPDAGYISRYDAPNAFLICPECRDVARKQ